MSSIRRPVRPTRLGAWGVTAVLALGSITSLGNSGSGASASAPARRLQPPTTTAAPADPINQAVALTNEARTAAGLAPLTELPAADAAAAGHAADQAGRATMTHIGSDGSTPGQRLTADGVAWRTWGENVAYGQSSADQVIQAWLNSSTHRANMLNPAFTGIGVGVAASASGARYWTMDLVG